MRKLAGSFVRGTENVMRSFTLVAFYLTKKGIHESLFRFGYCLLSELVSEREVEKLLGLARTKNLCNASRSPLLCLGWRTNGLSRTCSESKVYKCGAVVAPDIRRFLFFLILLHLDTGCTISFLAKFWALQTPIQPTKPSRNVITMKAQASLLGSN